MFVSRKLNICQVHYLFQLLSGPGGVSGQPTAVVMVWAAHSTIVVPTKITWCVPSFSHVRQQYLGLQCIQITPLLVGQFCSLSASLFWPLYLVLPSFVQDCLVCWFTHQDKRVVYIHKKCLVNRPPICLIAITLSFFMHVCEITHAMWHNSPRTQW